MFECARDKFDIAELRSEIAEKGFMELPTRLSAESLNLFKTDIDRLSSEDGVEVNYGGSEHRIWKAHEKSDACLQFFNFSNQIISDLEEEDRVAHNILAIRNLALDDGHIGMREGRWHLDSFSRQLKVFVFLKDVSEHDGPFELLPGTQKMSFKIRNAIKAKYFTIRDFIQRGGQRSYSKIADEIVQKMMDKQPVKSFVVPAGTILVADTSAVHRACPVDGGERYALTSYYH